MRTAETRFAIAVSVPAAAISTRPSARFLTHPASPARCAVSRTNQRNPTPCTFPPTSKWTLVTLPLPAVRPSQERGEHRCQDGGLGRFGRHGRDVNFAAPHALRQPIESRRYVQAG
jgi:hypothetical protein